MKYKILNGKIHAKRPLGKPTDRWEEDIKIDVRNIVCDRLH
jgi:hypothetical protein